MQIRPVSSSSSSSSFRWQNRVTLSSQVDRQQEDEEETDYRQSILNQFSLMNLHSPTIEFTSNRLH